MQSRRRFITNLALGASTMAVNKLAAQDSVGQPTNASRNSPTDGIIEFASRTNGEFDRSTYCKLLGAANDFKEGDEIIGVSAADDAERKFARTLLANTRLRDVMEHPPYVDDLYKLTTASNPQASVQTGAQTGESPNAATDFIETTFGN